MTVHEIPIEESVGMTLAYDLTGITPGKEKGAVLRRGRILDESDLSILRAIGKTHIKILHLSAEEVHEDEAAEGLARMIAGPGIEVNLPGEAWADLVATQSGLLKVDAERLLRLNLLDDVLVATRHDNVPVQVGERLGRAKVRGLVVARNVLAEAERISAGFSPIVSVLPYRAVRAGAVITGREIYEGRKEDAFAPLLRCRLEEYGSKLVHTEIVPDEQISRAIRAALDTGLDMVFVTGGGSPDDSTSESIAECADEVVFHGVPVAPGAMTILAYSGNVPILGVPGGLLVAARGFFDLVMPRLLAGERLDKKVAAAYGHGGLCLRCPTCQFPACSFGK